MEAQGLLFSFCLIFSGAAVISSLALLGRQPLLVGYIVLGAIAGPYGMAWINDAPMLGHIALIGINFLLFLLGLDMQPSSLLHSLRRTLVVGLFSSVAFCLLGFTIAIAFSFSVTESWIVGAATMFSSTIIGIKLLPTTVLHHKQAGEIVVGVLLFQDLVAILILLFLGQGAQITDTSWLDGLIKTLFSLPLTNALNFPG